MRQAVIVIHGVGEQRPLETLRSFIRNVYSSKKYYSKPDYITEHLDLRRFQLAGDRNIPTTDFYEFYWAHHMRDTSFRMIMVWLKALLFKGESARKNLKGLFYLVRFLSLSMVLCGTYWVYELPLRSWIESGGQLIFVIALFIVAYSVWKVTYETVGKAARYLTPSPDNIEQRNRIRQEGIELLDSLHKSKRYRRIIIVGHSLGSVIGYDIIRHYWERIIYPDGQFKEEIVHRQVHHQPFRDYRAAVADLDNNKITASAYQNKQHALWREFQNMGLQWLVSDLITIGSPLSHAQWLLADNADEFKERIEGGEYPTCPPIKSNNKKSWIRLDDKIEGAKRSTWFPPHNYVFSCVRWTNLYFEQQYVFFGDPIGGPIADVLGRGIVDVGFDVNPFDVNLESTRLSWECHTKYWEKTLKGGDSEQLIALRRALHLRPALDEHVEDDSSEHSIRTSI